MKSGKTPHRVLSSILVVACLTALGLRGRAGASDRVFAEDAKPGTKKIAPVNWARPRKIDVRHVALDLRFDWAKKQAGGTASITLAPLDSTNRIALDAAFFTIKSVTSSAGVPLKFDYDGGDKNDNLRITLDRTYRPDEEVAVVIDYRTTWVNATDPLNLGGSNGKGIRFFEPTANDLNRPREIWSMGEFEGNRYWFPCHDTPNDFRTTEFKAAVDKPLTVISNGNLVETRDNGDGTRTFHWKADSPHANHLTAFVVGEYVDVRQTRDGITLHNFGYPKELEAVAASVERLPDMVGFLSSVTGVKYPHASYSQVFVQDMPWGVANHMFSTQTENMIDDDRTHADYLYLWDGLEAEALARQWFGSYITCADWSHVWLDRGFAHYFDGLYNEHANGHEEFLLWQVLGDHAAYLSDWNAGIRHPIVTKHYENPAVFAGDNYSYVRGAAVLHMLRKHLGEENWLKTIRRYVKTNAGQSVATEDFRKAVEAATGEPMDWFFDQWLYKMGHPVFEVAESYDQANRQLVLKVKQVQTVDPNEAYPQVDFFRGKVEVEIDGRIESVHLEPKAENVFFLASPQPPKLVNFDYEDTWIKEIKFEKSLEELTYQLLNDKDVLGRRWAMTELVKSAQDERTTSEEKTRIFDAFRNVMTSDACWRLRMAATRQLQALLAPSTQTGPARLDEATVATLLRIIKNEKAWTRAAAVAFLGMTEDPKYADVYLDLLGDQSERVVNAAAVALGQSKSPRAFDALATLVNKPSWKNQSLMSSLGGLRKLGDPRGFDIAYKALADPRLARWRLPVPPVWDYRVFAVDTIMALGRADAAYPLILGRFRKALEEDDVSGVYNNVVLAVKLADPRGRELFEMLKAKYKDAPDALTVVQAYETQFRDALKKP